MNERFVELTGKGEKIRLSEGRQILNDFIETVRNIRIDSTFSEIVELILECRGKIITTGMGKAGIAMRKFTSTLCSLGFPSAFLHPGEASHGDLGLLSTNDILFVASTSGKTREVIEIIELARINVGIKKVVGITSHPDSELRKQADVILDMGNIKEAGLLSLAPTSSILVMLALTDALALTAAKEKGLTKEEYGKYHHGGYLGAKARGDSDIK